MKKAQMVLLVSCAVFFALVFSCGSAPSAKKTMGGEWKVNADEGNGGGSTISMTEETLEGLPGRSFTGKLDKKKYQYGYVNAKLYPTQEVLDEMKQAKSISFRFIGNSEKYIVSIATTDVKDNAWFEYVFETQMNTPKTVIVPIEYFMQPAWGKTIAATVNMNNVTFLQWMYNGDEGPYDFKVWDVRVHSNVPAEKDIAPKASVAMKAAAPSQAQPVGGSLTGVVWDVVDNFEYADGYMIYFADPRVFNGNKVTKGDSYTLKYTCTASRDLESEMRIYLVDHLASSGHNRLSKEEPIPGTKLKAGVPYSGEVKFLATASATGVRPMANAICMETSGAGTKGIKGSGKLKPFTITFSQFEFSKD
jgi:hypothetical protein